MLRQINKLWMCSLGWHVVGLTLLVATNATDVKTATTSSDEPTLLALALDQTQTSRWTKHSTLRETRDGHADNTKQKKTEEDCEGDCNSMPDHTHSPTRTTLAMLSMCSLLASSSLNIFTTFHFNFVFFAFTQTNYN